MNRELKKLLEAAYEPPAPRHKQEFLRRIGCFEVRGSGIGWFRFLMTQVSYIEKWVWIVSFAVFFTALGYGILSDKNAIWLFSAIIPFLAVTFITESIRSEAYGMAELEMASRFSLKSLLLARMEILGLMHLLALCLLAFISSGNSGITLFRTGVYLLVPYLLTDAAGLWIARKVHGREAVYGSLAAAVVIGFLPVFLRYIQNLVYDQKYFIWWLAALVILGGITLSELKKSMKRTEEYTWNLL